MLSSARILSLRAQNNENLALISRGNGDAYVAEFDRVDEGTGWDRRHGRTPRLRRPSSAPGPATAERIGELAKHFTAFRDLHSQVRGLDDDGNYNDAVFISVGTGDWPRSASSSPPSGASRAVSCHRRRAWKPLSRATSCGRRRDSTAAAHDARNGFGVLAIAIPLFAILAGLLVLLGLERRIGEYR